MNKGNHKKQIREFARSLGLEKKFGRKIFSDGNSMIKYKLKFEESSEEKGYDSLFGVDRYNLTLNTFTKMDIYATNKENAIKIYDKLDDLFDKINEKLGKGNGKENFGRFINGNPHSVKD